MIHQWLARICFCFSIFYFSYPFFWLRFPLTESTMPKIGEVRVPCDKDFDEFKRQIDDDEGWTLAYDKKKVQIFHKKSDVCSFLMFKVKAEFDDVSANVLYDVLCDGEYRPEWDNNMAEGYDYCLITPYSDIGYFQLKSPKPFKNRDFVTQRCWLDYGDNKDKIIYSHSVNHAVS